jgi:hypothetical protein
MVKIYTSNRVVTPSAVERIPAVLIVPVPFGEEKIYSEFVPAEVN